MTLSIQQREVNLARRENRIIEIEQRLCRQQQRIEKLLRQISRNQSPHLVRSPTIGQVIERFATKLGKRGEETKRKRSAIYKYIGAIGLKLRNKYSDLHNERALLKIVTAIMSRPDIKGDQQARHMRWVRELIKFAAVAYPDMYGENVLIGMPAVKRTPKGARRPHTPYSDLQLKRIFDPKHKFFYKYPDIFWGCMIALFTGARRNAVFTLQYKDIIQCDGIWCINFIEDCPGIKKLKTEESQRIVPIHSTLIKMGFLDYVFRRPHIVPTDFIFKSICLTSNGRLNLHMGRNFFCFLNQIGVRGDNGHYDFHSFRKNANITMERCGIIRSYIDKIIGWRSRGSEGERSYSNYTIKQLSDQLELLRYDCLRVEFKQWRKLMAKIRIQADES